jgi:hypothetical protein
MVIKGWNVKGVPQSFLLISWESWPFRLRKFQGKHGSGSVKKTMSSSSDMYILDPNSLIYLKLRREVNTCQFKFGVHCYLRMFPSKGRNILRREYGLQFTARRKVQ